MVVSKLGSSLDNWNFKALSDSIKRDIDSSDLEQAAKRCNEAIEQALKINNRDWVKRFRAIQKLIEENGLSDKTKEEETEIKGKAPILETYAKTQSYLVALAKNINKPKT